MVIVTPYMVRAVARKELSRPDDGFADRERSGERSARPLQPHLRRRRQAEPPDTYHGKYGFILD